MGLNYFVKIDMGKICTLTMSAYYYYNEGQSLPFPIDFDGRPYNTLTLPCERVIVSVTKKIANLRLP